MHKLLLLLLLLTIPTITRGQSTSVSATIVDADSVAWANGTYTFTSAAYPTVAIITGTLDASGSFTNVTFPINNATAGVGGRWTARICPVVTAPCFSTVVLIPGGATLSLSGNLSPPAIRLAANSQTPLTAYNDVEITGAVQGNTYFNVTDLTEHTCKAIPCSSNWISVPNSGGAGSFTSLSVSGTTTLATLNCKNFEGMRCVDGNNTQGWAGADQGARINSAMQALVNDDGTVLVFDSGVWSTNIFSGITRPVTIHLMGCPTITVSTVQIPANANMKVIGEKEGCATFFINNATMDLFDPTGTGFEFGWAQVRLNGGITRTAGWVSNPGAAATQANFHDLFLVDTYNGFKFAADSGNGPSYPRVSRIFWTGNSGLHNGTLLQVGGCQTGGCNGGGISDAVVENIISLGDLSTHDAPLTIIDGGSDTIKAYHYDIATSQGSVNTQPTLVIQNTTVTAADPRWLRFNDMSLEGGSSSANAGAECIQVSKGNNIVFSGLYSVSCKRGFVYSGGTGIKIKGGIIGRNYQGGFINTAAVAGADLQIEGVDFSNNSTQTTNTTDDISIFNGTTGFSISGNKFGSAAISLAQKSRYGVNEGGASTNDGYIVNNNVVTGNLGTAFLNAVGGFATGIVEDPYDSLALGTGGAIKVWGNCSGNNQCLTIANSAGQTWQVGEPMQANIFSVRNASNGQSWSFDSGVNFEGRFHHANTAQRIWNLPDASGNAAIDSSNTYNPANGIFTGAWQCTNVTPVTVNANVATDQNLMACTIPAGTLNRVGRSLQINIAGVYSTVAASTASLTYKVKLCTVSGCGSGTVITLASIATGTTGALTASNFPFNLTLQSTTQTAGASSAYEAHGRLVIDITSALAADSVFADSNTATVGTIDDTAQLFLQTTAASASASASNSWTQRQMIVQTVN